MPEEYREGEDSGGGEKSSNVRGTEKMQKRVGISADDAGIAKFTKMFKGLSSELEKTNKSMKNLVKTARDLKNIWDKTDAPDMPGGGGGGTGKTDAGGVPSNGNFLKAGAAYGLSRAGFSPTMAGGAAFAAHLVHQAALVAQDPGDEAMVSRLARTQERLERSHCLRERRSAGEEEFSH